MEQNPVQISIKYSRGCPKSPPPRGGVRRTGEWAIPTTWNIIQYTAIHAFLRLPPGARKVAASASVGHAQTTRRAMSAALRGSGHIQYNAGLSARRDALPPWPPAAEFRSFKGLRRGNRAPRGPATVVVMYRRCPEPFVSPQALCLLPCHSRDRYCSTQPDCHVGSFGASPQ